MSLDRIVEIAFGYGPFDTVGAWTDVSDYVAVHGDTVFATMTRGRSGEGITPGSASVTFENQDGRFDPRNTGGPYHGDLKVGTPIRFRCPTVADPDGTVWSGFVSSGWPTALTTTFPTVTVTCHDLFGLLAQGSAPATAFDAAVRSASIRPDHWWRPGPTGWVDQITGITARHTAALTEMDPLVNGDENTWGQEQPDGIGYTTNPTAGLVFDAVTDWTVISAWIRLIPASERVQIGGRAETVEVISIWADFYGGVSGYFERAALRVVDNRIWVTVTTPAGVTSWGTEWDEVDIQLMDGRTHHVMVSGRPEIAIWGAPPPSYGGECHLWIDGRHFDGRWQVDSFPMTSPGGYTPLDTRIGGGAPPNGGTPWVPYQGVIDHLSLWSNVPGDPIRDGGIVGIEALAQSLFAAGRFGWGNQRLDERVSNLVTSMGALNQVGSFDTSGIVALQSYRPAEPLQLLQTVEDTEQGRIWVDRYGDIRYSNRQWAWNDPRSTTPQASFSTIGADIDGGAVVLLEEGTDIVDDPLDLVNVAQVTSAFGRMQTVTDDTSIAELGQRNPIHLSGLLHRSDAESRAIAEWIIASRSTPRPRARQVAFDANDPNAGTFAVDVSEGDLVEITVGAPTDCDGTPIGADQHLAGHVTQVARTWSRDRHTVTLALDSTRTDSTWFRWGTSEWDNTVSEGWSF